MIRIDTSPWLADPDFARLFAVLGDAGQVRFIGGMVRDALANLPHTDIDLGTKLTPKEVTVLGRQAGFKIVPTGIEHGTVSAILPRGTVEITTLRRDIETDGRRAVVAFTDDWREDAARRDFTINALSADGMGAVFDYFGGVADLAAGRVRFIGAAAERIAEDYLRILRFFRFAARFGKREFDAEALNAIRQAAPQIATLSGERLREETLKILAGPQAVRMLRAMEEAGVLAAYLPTAQNFDRLAGLIDVETRHNQADAFRRLMALLPECPAEEVIERLRLSNAEKKRLSALMPEAACLEALRHRSFAQALYAWGVPEVADQLFLAAATDPIYDALIPEFTLLAANWQVPQFPLGGEQLMQIGLKPGPIFKELLEATELWWMAHDFTPTRQECFAELKKIWAERKKLSHP
jgi:poly(A) polymerase